MMTEPLAQRLKEGELDARLKEIYVSPNAIANAKTKLTGVLEEFQREFPDLEPSLYTASGRTEMGGNHTDHQRGRVLAAAVDMESVAVGAHNGTNVLRVVSTQYPENAIDLTDLEPKIAEEGKSISLARGIARAITDRGYKLEGATILTLSGVPGGSGLSSSAAFEVLIANVLNHLFCNDELDAVEIAKIGQYAENVYFGKPSGLMDQMACSVGGIIGVDFGDPANPEITKVDFSLDDAGYVMCILDSGADHADLTGDYSAITEEMYSVANYFGEEFLGAVDPEKFWQSLGELRGEVSNRAIARAAHFFMDDARVPLQMESLAAGNFVDFLNAVKESGQSSGIYLQNLHSVANDDQSVILTIALAEHLLGTEGAVRVHGGGFAGTVQAYVPTDQANSFKTQIEKILGEGSCHIINIRPIGGAFIGE